MKLLNRLRPKDVARESPPQSAAPQAPKSVDVSLLPSAQQRTRGSAPNLHEATVALRQQSGAIDREYVRHDRPKVAMLDYDTLVEANPRQPYLHVKRHMLANRCGRVGRAQEDQEAMELVASAIPDQLAVWTSLYFDRIDARASHLCYNMSLAQLLYVGGADKLVTSERIHFLRSNYGHCPETRPLGERVARYGTSSDVNALLNFSRDCWGLLLAERDHLLDHLLPSPLASFRMAPDSMTPFKAVAMLEEGARPKDETTRAQLVRAALASSHIELLQKLLDLRLVDPSYVLKDAKKGASLVQCVAATTVPGANNKLALLLQRGASLYEYPNPSSLRSPWREAAAHSTQRMREFVDAGFSAARSDFYSGDNALFALVRDDGSSRIVPLLRIDESLLTQEKLGIDAFSFAQSLDHKECAFRLKQYVAFKPLIRTLRGHLQGPLLDTAIENAFALGSLEKAELYVSLVATLFAGPWRKQEGDAETLTQLFCQFRAYEAMTPQEVEAVVAYAKTASSLKQATKLLSLLDARPSSVYGLSWDQLLNAAPFSPEASDAVAYLQLSQMIQAAKRFQQGAIAICDAASRIPLEALSEREVAAVLATVGDAYHCNSNLLWLHTFLSAQGKSRKWEGFSRYPTASLSDMLHDVVQHFAMTGEVPRGLSLQGLGPRPRPFDSQKAIRAQQKERARLKAKAVAALCADSSMPPVLRQAVQLSIPTEGVIDVPLDRVSLPQVQALHAALADELTEDRMGLSCVQNAVARVMVATLGEARSTLIFDATPAQADKALRQLFIKVHPDRAARGAAEQAKAEQQTVLLGRVRELLQHAVAGPLLRQAYFTHLQQSGV